MKKLVIVLALLASAMSAQAETITLTPIKPDMGLGSSGPPRPTGDKKRPVVLYFKDHSQRYFTGKFIGWVAVTDSNHQLAEMNVPYWKPNGEPKQVAEVNKATAKQLNMKAYWLFKGEHSTLLYRANEDWFIIEK